MTKFTTSSSLLVIILFIFILLLSSSSSSSSFFFCTAAPVISNVRLELAAQNATEITTLLSTTHSPRRIALQLNISFSSTIDSHYASVGTPPVLSSLTLPTSAHATAAALAPVAWTNVAADSFDAGPTSRTASFTVRSVVASAGGSEADAFKAFLLDYVKVSSPASPWISLSITNAGSDTKIRSITAELFFEELLFVGASDVQRNFADATAFCQAQDSAAFLATSLKSYEDARIAEWIDTAFPNLTTTSAPQNTFWTGATLTDKRPFASKFCWTADPDYDATQCSTAVAAYFGYYSVSSTTATCRRQAPLTCFPLTLDYDNNVCCKTFAVTWVKSSGGAAWMAQDKIDTATASHVCAKVGRNSTTSDVPQLVRPVVFFASSATRTISPGKTATRGRTRTPTDPGTTTTALWTGTTTTAAGTGNATTTTTAVNGSDSLAGKNLQINLTSPLPERWSTAMAQATFTVYLLSSGLPPLASLAQIASAASLLPACGVASSVVVSTKTTTSSSSTSSLSNSTTTTRITVHRFANETLTKHPFSVVMSPFGFLFSSSNHQQEDSNSNKENEQLQTLIVDRMLTLFLLLMLFVLVFGVVPVLYRYFCVSGGGAGGAGGGVRNNANNQNQQGRPRRRQQIAVFNDKGQFEMVDEQQQNGDEEFYYDENHNDDDDLFNLDYDISQENRRHNNANGGLLCCIDRNCCGHSASICIFAVLFFLPLIAYHVGAAFSLLLPISDDELIFQQQDDEQGRRQLQGLSSGNKAAAAIMFIFVIASIVVLQILTSAATSSISGSDVADEWIEELDRQRQQEENGNENGENENCENNGDNNQNNNNNDLLDFGDQSPIRGEADRQHQLNEIEDENENNNNNNNHNSNSAVRCVRIVTDSENRAVHVEDEQQPVFDENQQNLQQANNNSRSRSRSPAEQQQQRSNSNGFSRFHRLSQERRRRENQKFLFSTLLVFHPLIDKSSLPLLNSGDDHKDQQNENQNVAGDEIENQQQQNRQQQENSNENQVSFCNSFCCFFPFLLHGCYTAVRHSSPATWWATYDSLRPRYVQTLAVFYVSLASFVTFFVGLQTFRRATACAPIAFVVSIIIFLLALIVFFALQPHRRGVLTIAVSVMMFLSAVILWVQLGTSESDYVSSSSSNSDEKLFTSPNHYSAIVVAVVFFWIFFALTLIHIAWEYSLFSSVFHRLARIRQQEEINNEENNVNVVEINDDRDDGRVGDDDDVDADNIMPRQINIISTSNDEFAPRSPSNDSSDNYDLPPRPPPPAPEAATIINTSSFSPQQGLRFSKTQQDIQQQQQQNPQQQPQPHQQNDGNRNENDDNVYYYDYDEVKPNNNNQHHQRGQSGRGASSSSQQPEEPERHPQPEDFLFEAEQPRYSANPFLTGPRHHHHHHHFSPPPIIPSLHHLKKNNNNRTNNSQQQNAQQEEQNIRQEGKTPDEQQQNNNQNEIQIGSIERIHVAHASPSPSAPVCLEDLIMDDEEEDHHDTAESHRNPQNLQEKLISSSLSPFRDFCGSNQNRHENQHQHRNQHRVSFSEQQQRQQYDDEHTDDGVAVAGGAAASSSNLFSSSSSSSSMFLIPEVGASCEQIRKFQLQVQLLSWYRNFVGKNHREPIVQDMLDDEQISATYKEYVELRKLLKNQKNNQQQNNNNNDNNNEAEEEDSLLYRLGGTEVERRNALNVKLNKWRDKFIEKHHRQPTHADIAKDVEAFAMYEKYLTLKLSRRFRRGENVQDENQSSQSNNFSSFPSGEFQQSASAASVFGFQNNNNSSQFLAFCDAQVPSPSRRALSDRKAELRRRLHAWADRQRREHKDENFFAHNPRNAPTEADYLLDAEVGNVYCEYQEVRQQLAARNQERMRRQELSGVMTAATAEEDEHDENQNEQNEQNVNVFGGDATTATTGGGKLSVWRLRRKRLLGREIARWKIEFQRRHEQQQREREEQEEDEENRRRRRHENNNGEDEEDDFAAFHNQLVASASRGRRVVASAAASSAASSGVSFEPTVDDMNDRMKLLYQQYLELKQQLEDEEHQQRYHQ